jgi:Ca2+-dependent lipid-binding protein
MSMLSGIQVGKRKRRDDRVQQNLSKTDIQHHVAETLTSEVKEFTDDMNKKAASQLRAILNAKSDTSSGQIFEEVKHIETADVSDFRHNPNFVLITAHKPEVLQRGWYKRLKACLPISFYLNIFFCV